MSVDLSRLPIAVDILVRMGARRVILFGSAAETPDRARDIDLAVEGIPPERLLDADVALMDILRQPFDLVSLESDLELGGIISAYGKVLHG